MNTFSKTMLGLMMISLVIITIIMYNILETSRENKKLYNKLDLLLSSPAHHIAAAVSQTVPEKNIQSESTLRGIDVSHWNGNITEDLPKKDQLNFVICKSTQGEHEVDPDFRKNWKFLEEKNIKKGAYHFYVYSQNPIQQAIHFSNTVGEIKHSDFPLIIDIEEGSLPRKYIDQHQLKADLLKFLEYIERKTNRTPVIYSDYAFINRYIDDDAFSKYPLWLAEYSHASKPAVPKVWKNKGCMIWQKTDRYDISSTEVDFDVYYK
ncbi:GH25 family lysozyme [Chryseobacterium sp. JUb7]|uniref:GH25 family lysozyme n=1 Tax=Chryseobacterium sp. JUb7 TaxID=2940599 RepID=UPI002167EE8E|nr:GH25 family lysozyme [Chryseobacterium sp. JUb7]MCS3529170.1 lysozyme [Chryseobacterium sp. JUb7]